MGKKRQHDVRLEFNSEKVFLAAKQPLDSVYNFFQTSRNGLSAEEVERRQEFYGKNVVVHETKKNPVVQFCRAFINPFIGVLTILVIISFVIDVLLAEPGDKDWTSIIIILVLILISAILRFSQEWKANRESEALKKLVRNTCYVRREGMPGQEIPFEEIVPGDIVELAAGDMIPGDLRIIRSKDLFVSQASLTGESNGIEKTPEIVDKHFRKGSVVELDDICFMGSTVLSGSATGIVFETGNDTYLGTVAKSIVGVRAVTAFDKGITKVSLLLIRYMLVMVPFVFVVNGLTKGNWFEAFIFGVSVAVGLTPEMLPMIVTANLSRGAVAMSKKKTVVKDLNAIQNFGAMNILCTDKTGTLTRDHIVLERHINADGTVDTQNRILRHAYFNSYFQTGLKNLMDRAILSHVKELGLESIGDNYSKVDEIPFDFVRRRMSVVVKDQQGKKQIITKGAVEEMLSICSYAEIGGQVLELDEKTRRKAEAIVTAMNNQGLRVLALAHKSNFIDKDEDFREDDETDMVLIGYLAFLDPPKESASQAIRQLHEHGIKVKVLSGDNDAVVKTIARQVGINVETVVSGPTFATMTSEERTQAVAEGNVFSKLTPIQKVEIIQILQNQNNTVGFLGDGINDAAALRESDIGISVDNAVDIAKESADIILLEKDLMVLEDGVLEGRSTFGNIIKYVKMAASSNFGNVFSVLIASAFLPFLPMMPIHLLIQNLLYDISQTAIPFDRMDEEYLRKPRVWDSSDISRFMLRIGPISCIFDITTYILMWYFITHLDWVFGMGMTVPDGMSIADYSRALFQTGWFVEGLVSQTLIVHMIRTRKIPFIQSRASWPLMTMSVTISIIGMCIPFTLFGHSVGMVNLPPIYFMWLGITLLAYGLLTQLIKVRYIRRFGRWL